jgi:hypothetical protein
MVELLDGKPVEGERVFILWDPSVDYRLYIYGGQAQPFLHTQIQVGSWCGGMRGPSMPHQSQSLGKVNDKRRSTNWGDPVSSLLHFGGCRHHSLRRTEKVEKPAAAATETRTCHTGRRNPSAIPLPRH